MLSGLAEMCATSVKLPYTREKQKATKEVSLYLDCPGPAGVSSLRYLLCRAPALLLVHTTPDTCLLYTSDAADDC